MNNVTEYISKNEYRVFEFDDLRPSRIVHHIRDNIEDSRKYLYLIMGNPGPTGKTWLYEGLKQYGYNVVEIAEDICYHVKYTDKRNHYRIDPARKLVTIILNEQL